MKLNKNNYLKKMKLNKNNDLKIKKSALKENNEII